MLPPDLAVIVDALERTSHPIDRDQRMQAAAAIRRLCRDTSPRPPWSRFAYGERVRKHSGSSWQGRVVGWPSTAGRTPQGLAVESEREPGNVQIYPEHLFEAVPEEPVGVRSDG